MTIKKIAQPISLRKEAVRQEKEREQIEYQIENLTETRMVVDRVHFTYGKKHDDNQEQSQEQELTPVNDDNLPF